MVVVVVKIKLFVTQSQLQFKNLCLINFFYYFFLFYFIHLLIKLEKKTIQTKRDCYHVIYFPFFLFGSVFPSGITKVISLLSEIVFFFISAIKILYFKV